MELNIEKQGLVRILSIEEEGKQIGNLEKDVIREFKKEVNIPGFRKGQIPDSVIKARYKKAIKEEVARRYIQNNLDEILKEADLTPVSTDINFGDIDLGKNKLSLKISFEVAPEFELSDYKGLEVETTKIEITEKDIENYLKELQERYATYEPAEEGKEVEIGDKLKIHYNIETEKGEKEEDEIEVVVGANQLRPEIEEKIIGKKVGDEVSVENVDLYDEKGNVIGKATVKVKIVEIQKKALPKIDDELVKKANLGETLEEAKEKIKNNMKQEAERVRDFDIETKLLNILTDKHEFEVPQSLLKAELEYLVNSYAKQLEQSGIKVNNDIISSIIPTLENTAVKNVKSMFIIYKIAEAEGIEVSEEELNKKIEEMAKNEGINVDEFKEMIEGEGYLAGINYDLLKKKVLKFLKENAKLIELTKEELEARKSKELEGSEELPKEAENQKETKEVSSNEQKVEDNKVELG